MSESLDKNSQKSAPSAQIDEILITIQFYSTMRNIAGVTEIERTIRKQTSLIELLEQIERELFLPKSSHILKADHSDLEAGIICLVDEADMHLTGGLKQKLRTKCKITMISSLHGG